MKRTLFTLLLVTILLNTRAQIVANDSASTGAGNTQMVYYQLSTGNKTSTSNTDWHLAITVRATQFPNAPLGGTTIRINEAMGVKALYVPNTNAAGFSTLDTTGWQSWEQLHDQDVNIDEGALNSHRSSNIFDFGWGVYNSTSHDVVGDSLYLIKLPDGSIKKLWVEKLVRDTSFNITYANIDNSNQQNITISKRNYQGKQFVYLDMLTNTVRDKEPLANAWDLQFLKYEATDVLPDTTFPAVGVWVNKNAQVAEAAGVDVNSNDYNSLTFSNTLNTIGWNWKDYDYQNNNYIIADSLAYFVKTQGNEVYKVIFTGYTGSAGGVISFYKEWIPLSTGISHTANATLSVYPNPANGHLYVQLGEQAGTLRLLSTEGRLLQQAEYNGGITQLDVSQLTPGVYFLTAQVNGQTLTRKVAIQ